MIRLRKIASGMSRVQAHFQNGQFGIVSAFRAHLPLQENLDRQQELADMVRELGYGYIPVIGHWEGTEERSLFLPNIGREDTNTLSADFQQNAYVWGSKGIWGVYDTGAKEPTFKGTAFKVSSIDNEVEKALAEGRPLPDYSEIGEGGPGKRFKLESKGDFVTVTTPDKVRSWRPAWWNPATPDKVYVGPYQSVHDYLAFKIVELLGMPSNRPVDFSYLLDAGWVRIAPGPDIIALEGQVSDDVFRDLLWRMPQYKNKDVAIDTQKFRNVGPVYEPVEKFLAEANLKGRTNMRTKFSARKRLADMSVDELKQYFKQTGELPSQGQPEVKEAEEGAETKDKKPEVQAPGVEKPEVKEPEQPGVEQTQGQDLQTTIYKDVLKSVLLEPDTAQRVVEKLLDVAQSIPSALQAMASVLPEEFDEKWATQNMVQIARAGLRAFQRRGIDGRLLFAAKPITDEQIRKALYKVKGQIDASGEESWRVSDVIKAVAKILGTDYFKIHEQVHSVMKHEGWELTPGAFASVVTADGLFKDVDWSKVSPFSTYEAVQYDNNGKVVERWTGGIQWFEEGGFFESDEDYNAVDALNVGDSFTLAGGIEIKRVASVVKTAERRFCYWIDEMQDPKRHGGFVPSVVYEDESGHYPLTGKGPGSAPWIWGKTLEEAKAIASDKNKELGLSNADVYEITSSSMFPGFNHEEFKRLVAENPERFAATTKEAVSPPGWKGTVEHMKEHKDIEEPWALAWYMKEEGDEPHYTEKGTKKKSVTFHAVKPGGDRAAIEKAIRAAQAKASSGEAWDYDTNITAMQKSIDTGQAWHMEGSWGRAAMDMLEQGICFLPASAHNDYWGNRVPSRDDLKSGTKGTLENAMRYWGIGEGGAAEGETLMSKEPRVKKGPAKKEKPMGTEGQDRKSYTDEQDRESYKAGSLTRRVFAREEEIVPGSEGALWEGLDRWVASWVEDGLTDDEILKEIEGTEFSVLEEDGIRHAIKEARRILGR